MYMVRNLNAEDSPAAVSNVIGRELPQFAFQALLQRRWVFQQSDFANAHLSEHILKLGIFVSCTTKENECLYRFSHIRLQCYMAAAGAVAAILVRQQDVDQLVLRLGRSDKYYRVFWRFVYDVLGDVSQSLQHHLIAALSSDSHIKLDAGFPGSLLCFAPISADEIVTISNTLLEFIRFDVMILLAGILLNPLMENRSNGRAALEKRLRDNNIAKRDDLYLLELLQYWKELFPLCHRYMLFRALENALTRSNVDATALAPNLCLILLGPTPSNAGV